ncbi:hypothetical protein LTR62_007083 [Meristemomyces frigidus]|uniref:DNA-directed RNA polymerase subunit n=1 Tax=Meristemomyces frigidus TaxID=1508187 RepID=A0AAN7TB40_9PEZI|nr:hypothetical protein LTR62_007083 [Meristemomyces frigidus]
MSAVPILEGQAVQKTDKAVGDSSAKKRKREEEQTNGVAAEHVKKKSKTKKSEISRTALNTIGQDEAVNEDAGRQEPGKQIVNGETQSSTTKQKKGKSNGTDSVQSEGTAAAEVVEAKSAKKKRKPKDDQGHGYSPKPTLATPSSSKVRPPANAADDNESDESSTLFDDKLLQQHSPFVQETHSLYLALSPCANAFPLEGLIAEHISPLLLTYYPPIKGVVLKYSNPRMSEHPDHESTNEEAVLSKAIDEYAVTFVWLTLDFLLLRPSRGTYLEGYVNLQNQSLLGLMCYNYFSAAIEFSRLPTDWIWKEDGEQDNGYARQRGGYWTNRYGEKMDGRVVFRVRDFDASGSGDQGVGSISIAGTLLSAKDDARLDDGERQTGLVGNRRR